MTPRRRIPLNPCDYLFYAHHRLLERQAPGGYTALMCIDAEGHADPGRVRRAVQRVLLAHPVLMAGLKVGWVLGRPRWQTPARAEEAAARAASRACVHTDLRGVPDAEERLEQAGLDLQHRRWPLESGPPLRLEQYDLPGGRTRFRLCWPHLLMDAEGAQWFLSELGRADPGEQGHSPSTPVDGPADDRPVDVLRGHSLAGRLRLFRRGLSLQKSIGNIRATPLVRDDGGPVEHRCLVRTWERAEVESLQAVARQVTPAGPALYARHLAACVLRALRRIYGEQGTITHTLVIPLPKSVSGGVGDGITSRGRSIVGNYLVSPNLRAEPGCIDDRAALGALILRQLQEYERNRADLAQWAAMWLASTMRVWMYDLVLRLPLGFNTLSSGFSYYGEITQPLRRIAGLTVTNLWGGGPMATPPGWNPTFSKFADRLNLSLTYNHPVVSGELAGRYLDLIEEEMFAGGASPGAPPRIGAGLTGAAGSTSETSHAHRHHSR
jgi:hypothetical protein